MSAAKSIKQLNADAKALLLEAKTIYDKGDDATPDEYATAATKTAEAQKIVESLDKIGSTDALKTINKIENTLSDFARVDRPAMGANNTVKTDGGGNGNGSPQSHDHANAVKTVGERITDHAAFKAWSEYVAPNGRIPEGVQTTSPPIDVKTLFTVAGDITAARPLLGQADRRMEMIPLNWNTLVLRDLITNLTTNSDLVEVPRELARENNAGFVAEATSASGSSGVKPESGLTFELVTAAVQTIAHWVPASTRVLSDAKQLEGIINAFLRDGLEQALEAAMLTGTGTSPSIRGINNTTGILTQAYVTSMLITARKARTKLKVTGLEPRPNGWVMHPNDWEDLDLLLDGEQRYHFGGPLNMGNPKLWGVPIVESVYQTENVALLANFKHAVAYDREQTSIRIGNQHADMFIRNLLAILAEMRLAFLVQRPSSFVSVALA